MILRVTKHIRATGSGMPALRIIGGPGVEELNQLEGDRAK